MAKHFIRNPFNVKLKGNRFPTVKFEERTPGKFTVAVAPEDGASIDYIQAKVITMDEPLEHLVTKFPQSEDMRTFVNCLINRQQTNPAHQGAGPRGKAQWR